MKKTSLKHVIKVVIDKRENDQFMGCVSKKFAELGLNYEESTLPVGDIWLYRGIEPVIMAERKTLDDLNKSITDGRYDEQKLRMIDSKIPKKYYIVEGSLYKAGTSLEPIVKDVKTVPMKDHSRIYSSIVNTTVRDDIPVIRSVNMEETVNIIITLYNCLDKHGDKIVKEHRDLPTSKDYVETLKPAKKDNMTQSICYLSQLTQIPGISSTIAQSICIVYPSFVNLIKKYEECATDKMREELVKDIVLPTGRKIGPSVSSKLYNFIYVTGDRQPTLSQ